ncbi:hypothetical protein AURDEDRAFT_124928 [Auricularia subglabra TFB-10046 SS5]|nr:hypothetical protein AURDEDRAFT_124928 [Auricularia subglabra TFB-10046 SS5]
MCPRLQSLWLSLLRQSNIAVLGRPPASLSSLTLGTNSGSCNLVDVYAAYKDAPALQRVSLYINILGLEDDFGNALYGATEHTIDCSDTLYVILAVAFADGRQLTISWPRSTEYREPLPYLLFFKQPAPCFKQLRNVRLPLSVLPDFVADAPPLPALEELRVKITPNPDGPGFQWSELGKLQDLTASRVRIVLDVRHPDGLTADDARFLLAYLPRYAAHLTVTVHGFAADAVPGDVPDDVNVTFVPAE